MELELLLGQVKGKVGYTMMNIIHVLTEGTILKLLKGTNLSIQIFLRTT